jgi:hypothetical protein
VVRGGRAGGVFGPKGFRIFRYFWIQKDFICFFPKGFRIFGSKRFSYVSVSLISKIFLYLLYPLMVLLFGILQFSYLFDPKGFRPSFFFPPNSIL